MGGLLEGPTNRQTGAYADDIDAAVSARAGELGELLAEMAERGERIEEFFLPFAQRYSIVTLRPSTQAILEFVRVTTYDNAASCSQADS